MIVRVWGARLEASRVGDYVAFFRREVRPALEALPGFRGAAVLTRDGAPSEVIVESRWDSMDAVRAFTGPDTTRAVVEPEAARLFIEYDHTVRHYRVVDE